MNQRNLQTFDIGYNRGSNRIEEIPSGVFLSLQSLQQLDLGHNSIIGISAAAFDTLANLEILGLEMNETSCRRLLPCIKFEDCSGQQTPL